MKSQLFEQDKMEKEGVAGSFLLQNRHTLKVELNGEVYAKQGAMAAYQGNVEFSFHGGGVRRMLKKIVSGENLQLMKVSGEGRFSSRTLVPRCRSSNSRTIHRLSGPRTYSLLNPPFSGISKW